MSYHSSVNKFIQRGFLFIIVLWNIQPLLALAAEEWTNVTDNSIAILPGSPLDFSRFNGADAAGSMGRIVTTKTGEGFQVEGGSAGLKMHCASLALSPATGGFPKGKDADAYAFQLKARGYNIARFHYVEATLMTRRDNDFDFDPVELDAWFYFLSALKKQGIYWVVDAMSSENGAVGGVYPHRWIRKYDFKRRIYFENGVKEHWKKLVSELLSRKNPYTGKTTLQDEALLGVITVNEGGINHLSGQKNDWPDGILEAFNRWLKVKYKDDASIQKAWGDMALNERLEDSSINSPKKLRERTPRMRDFQRYITSLEVDTARWMQDYLRGLGYRGAITGLDSWPSRQADLSRGVFEWIDMHGYHDESFGFSPGTKIDQTSALSNNGRYLRWIAASRQKGKPFSVTEYGQPFWNRYRYEASLMAPAMASLQDWSFICLHGEGAVDLSLKQSVPRKLAIHPYGVGIDPITIAGETLAALLMRRGDISSSSHKALINFSGAEFAGEPVDIIEDDISFMSWLLHIELDVSKDRQENTGFDLQFEAGGVAKSALGRALTRIPLVQENRAASVIEALQSSKILSSSNRSNARSGMFESETGEVLLDKEGGVFHVVTPRTIAFSSNRPIDSIKLGALTVSSLSSPALVALTSLDDQPLNVSRRMLMIFATDAQNYGMKFSDSSRSKLMSLGTMPPQISASSAKFSVETAVEGAFDLSSLALNGSEIDSLKLIRAGRNLSSTLDNSLGGRGVVFYLLKRKE